MAKRVFLFLLTNFLVITAVSILMTVFGVEPYLNERGIDYTSLLMMCALFGFVGSFISLQLSISMAKWTLGVQIVDQRSGGAAEWLYSSVERMARQAGLPRTPEVGIFESPEPNAFATGPSRSRSLVAVSTGLLQNMERDEVEAVLAHEVAHIANGDMVTMALLQGIANTFVMFFARVVTFVIDNALKDQNGRGGLGFIAHFFVVQILQTVFMLLASIPINWFSRQREYRADAGAARLNGANSMVRALQRLKNLSTVRDPFLAQADMQALQISAKDVAFAIFSTHPSLDDRIQRLRTGV